MKIVVMIQLLLNININIVNQKGRLCKAFSLIVLHLEKFSV